MSTSVMNTTIFDKTEKGRDEIATRRNRLPSRLRTLLVMMDGRQAIDVLLPQLAGLGLGEDSVYELLAQDYIAPAGGELPTKPAHPTAIPPTPVFAPAPAPQPAAAPVAATRPAARPGAPTRSKVPSDPALQFRAIYDFYNQTIKSTLGLRGFTLQLKMERAGSVDDFRDLRRQYVEAVLKAKGPEMARSLRDRLDQLLGGKPEYESVLLPGD